MFVMLMARTPCPVCGFQHKVHRFSTVRINRRSLRETGPSLVSYGEVFCPECREPNAGGLVPVSGWVLDPEDAVKVVACRERRWPGSTTGVAA